MMDARIIDKMPQFKLSARKAMAAALNDAAKDILINSRKKAPLDKGGLRSPYEPINHVTPLKVRIQYDAPYARFQEFGGDSTRRVRNYTTAGTGPHFLRNAGDNMRKKLPSVIMKYAIRARV